MLNSRSLQLAEPKPLPGKNTETPFVFVSNEALPLIPNLMRPYPIAEVNGNYKNKCFNYKLFQARQTVESSFEILTARFRLYNF